MGLLQTACWLLPASKRKNRILGRYGHQIPASARIAPNLVLGVKKFELGENCALGPFNTFKNNSLIHLEDEAGIGSFNWISAHPAYQELDAGAGTLVMGYGARIEGRNYFDCSGTIEIGAYSAVGGQRCTLQSHEPDMRAMVQTVGRITIGHHSLVGSNAVLLKGANLPPQSVLAAHATMLFRGQPNVESGVYAGTPAKRIGDIGGAWFERTKIPITDIKIDGVVGVDWSSLDRGTELPSAASDE